MIQILVFDNLDPWITEQRRDWHGRFAGGGGGGGRSSSGGGGTRNIKPGRKGHWGTHTQKVTGYTSQGKKRTASVSSTTRSLNAGKGKRSTAYVYKIGKRGRVLKNPSKMASRYVSSSSRFRPGTPVGSKNVRYISRAHSAARMISMPGSNARILGRAHSKSVVARAKRGGTFKPGYVVSYGKPLGSRRP